MPIGGVKEKTLAARRAGVKTIILPKRNEKDLEDVPPNVREEMEFRFVENIDEVLDLALSQQAIPIDTPEASVQARPRHNTSQRRSAPLFLPHLV